MKISTLLALSLSLTSLTGLAQEPALKIYSGAPDTTYSATTTLVAVTEPGATATINGSPVNVYKTGSFGQRLVLNPGNNPVTVTATLNGTTSTIERNIYYNSGKPKAKKAANPADDMTLMYATPRYVTTTQDAYIQYGNGGDRLGGSKMGFIDSDIPLTVIGEKDGLYCVRLSSNRIGYIPKSYTKPASEGTQVVNTGSWSIVNTGSSDLVTVALPVRLPYQYSTRIDPSEIVIDIFGATDNSNWITQRSAELGIIDFVDFEQVTEDTYRVILRLKKKYQWGYSVHYNGNALEINVRHQPKSLALKDLVIGLDAGHGGEFPGAISPSGIKEKDVNLDIVNRVKAILEKKGAKIVMTRTGDTGPSMGERKRIWREGNVNIAISVHNNSGGGALDSPGTAVLYKHLSDRPLAASLLNRILETKLPLFGLVGNFNFSLNGPTEFPNALIEGMFMSSLIEEEKLADPDFRQLFAEKIVAGLEDYLKSAK